MNNYGMSFGWNFPGITLVSGIVLLGLIVWAIREKSWQLGLVVLGGGLNFYQRVTLGYVVDNWKIPAIPLYNNINDWLIVVGIGLYLWKKWK